MPGFCTHSLRATAATNALDHEADIAKVQGWLGHANIATTRLYDRRRRVDFWEPHSLCLAEEQYVPGPECLWRLLFA